MPTPHPPTPWKDAYRFMGWTHRLNIYGPGGEGVAQVGPALRSHSAQQAQVEANAAFIVRAVNNHEALVAALEQAADLVKIARRHFPKSIKHGDTFTLENANAAICAALADARREA